MNTATNPQKLPLVLVSHNLCPYVQRAAIVMLENDIDFSRQHIDLSEKPNWFTSISPLGKTPVLLVGDVALFESSIICEYLNEAYMLKMHSGDPLVRAQHRAWMEFGSTLLNTIGSFYSATTDEGMDEKTAEMTQKFARIEAILDVGPYFYGAQFHMVDAVFAPIFRYFDVFDQIIDLGIFARTPRLREWRIALRNRVSVQRAVDGNYDELLKAFLLKRNSALSRRMRSK